MKFKVFFKVRFLEFVDDPVMCIPYNFVYAWVYRYKIYKDQWMINRQAMRPWVQAAFYIPLDYFFLLERGGNLPLDYRTCTIIDGRCLQYVLLLWV